jgi:hypothetical protein
MNVDGKKRISSHFRVDEWERECNHVEKCVSICCCNDALDHFRYIVRSSRQLCFTLDICEWNSLQAHDIVTVVSASAVFSRRRDTMNNCVKYILRLLALTHSGCVDWLDNALFFVDECCVKAHKGEQWWFYHACNDVNDAVNQSKLRLGPSLVPLRWCRLSLERPAHTFSWKKKRRRGEGGELMEKPSLA